MKTKTFFCVFLLLTVALSVFCTAALATDYMPPVIISGSGSQPTPTVVTGVVTLTKSPTGETVDEHGSAIFIARADNATGITWRFVSPDTTITYTDTQVLTAFPGLSVEGLGTERIKLLNIPYSMNGWKAQAKFDGTGGPVLSEGAKITVIPAQVVYITATPAPTPVPTPAPTLAPVQTPVPTWAPAAPEGTMPPVVMRTADPQDSSLLPVPTPLPSPVITPAATPAPQSQVLGVSAADLLPLLIGAVLIAAMIIATTVYLVKTKPE